jgi:predicted RNA binding protein YcfA (HicA-like mRNA interferase family)
MTSRELLRRLRRVGATVVTEPGKGGHIMVVLHGRQSFMPIGSGELRSGTLHTILRDLGVTLGELRR